jgi:hypothetical protein
MALTREERERRAIAAQQHAIVEEQRAVIANRERQEALDRLRTTFESRESIAADFNDRFVGSVPPGLDIVRWSEEITHIDCATPAYPFRMTGCGSSRFIPGREDQRIVSAPTTDLARHSRAYNIIASIGGGNAYSIILGGTSADHPKMNASENMAALAACIRGAVCDLDVSYPRRIKSIVAVLEVNNGLRQDRVDAHAIIMIEGIQDLALIATHFQNFLYERGTMCRALHDTDDTQVNFSVGKDRLQKDLVFLQYMMKCHHDHRRGRDNVYYQRVEETMRSAGINTIANPLDNLFILHRKIE